GNAAVLLLTVNLADISMALGTYPLCIASAHNHVWIGCGASCLNYGLMGMIFRVTSIMTLTVMGMVRPLVTDRRKKVSNIVISGIRLHAELWALYPLLGWGSCGPEPFRLCCSMDWTSYGESLNHSTFILTLFVLCTFLPCLVIVFNFGIAWKLHRAYQSIQNNDCQYGNIEKKITLMAVMISPGFLIARTPYVAVSFWSMFRPRDQVRMTVVVTLLPCLFAKSSTTYNPFIYFVFQRRSRNIIFICWDFLNVQIKMFSLQKCSIFSITLVSIVC
uniref:Opsin 8, group member a n=1 Tax=Stegastes partitus TaxID=144197 RepID=A0A3B4ZV48_9TELE